MNVLLSLKHWQLRMFLNGLRNGRLRAFVGRVAGLVTLGLLVHWRSRSLFLSLSQVAADAPPGVLPALQTSLLSSMAMGLLLLLVVGGLRASYDTLFEGADLPFLLALPLPAHAVFTSKFLDAFGISLMLVGPVGLGLWTAFGVTVAAPPVYYVLAVLVCLLGALLFQSLVVLLLLCIVRFVPGQRLKQVFIVVAGLGAVVMVLVSQMIASGAIRSMYSDPLALFASVGRWGLGDVHWLPHVWMTKSLLLPLPAFAYTASESLVPLLLAALSSAAIAVTVAHRLYARGWAAAEDAASPGRKGRSSFDGPWPRGPFWAVLRKDLQLLRRDPLVWYHLLVGCIVVGFFFYNLRGLSGREVGPIGLLIPVMMAATAASQLGGVGISREGASWWLVRLYAPAASTLYWSKLVAALVPPCALTALAAAALVYATELALYPFLPTLLLMWVMTLGVVAFELLLDILMPNFSLKIEFGGGRRGQTGNTKVFGVAFAAMLYIAVLGLLLYVTGWVLPLVWVGLTVAVSSFWGRRRLSRLLSQDAGGA